MLYVKILFTTNTVVYIQAFIAIEKGFFELINDSLAEKYNLMMQIPAVCWYLLIILCTLLFLKAVVSVSSMLCNCWLGGRKGNWPVKNECWFADDADLTGALYILGGRHPHHYCFHRLMFAVALSRMVWHVRLLN